jgi:hypothetical protein
MMPNPALERTAASALRLLAAPSSLRSPAATQRERRAARRDIQSTHLLIAAVLLGLPAAGQEQVRHELTQAGMNEAAAQRLHAAGSRSWIRAS